MSYYSTNGAAVVINQFNVSNSTVYCEFWGFGKSRLEDQALWPGAPSLCCSRDKSLSSPNQLSYNHNLTLNILPNPSHNHPRRFSKSKITKSQRYLDEPSRPPPLIQSKTSQRRKNDPPDNTLAPQPSIDRSNPSLSYRTTNTPKPSSKSSHQPRQRYLPLFSKHRPNSQHLRSRNTPAKFRINNQHSHNASLAKSNTTNSPPPLTNSLNSSLELSSRARPATNSTRASLNSVSSLRAMNTSRANSMTRDGSFSSGVSANCVRSLCSARVDRVGICTVGRLAKR